MLRTSLLYLGLIFIISSCNVNFSASVSIRIDTNKDSLDIVYKKVQDIVNDMNHDEIKEKISNQFQDFNKENIIGSGLIFRKAWTVGEDTDANVYVRVTLNCGPSDSDKAMEVINSYESFIIEELKNNNINVIIEEY